MSESPPGGRERRVTIIGRSGAHRTRRDVLARLLNSGRVARSPNVLPGATRPDTHHSREPGASTKTTPSSRTQGVYP